MNLINLILIYFCYDKLYFKLNIDRNKAPPRPQGQRTEPEAQNPFMNGFGFGGGGEGGFQFHLGVGAFPFGFFALFNNGRHGHGQMPNGKPLKILFTTLELNS